MPNHITDKRYIADGVYAQFDGFGIVVTTEDGISVQNSIYFEPETFALLAKYVEEIKNRKQDV